MTQAPSMRGDANEEYARWLDDLAARRQFGAGDRRGTANLIDAAARRRAADALVGGVCIPLNRPIIPDPDDGTPTGGSGVRVRVHRSRLDGFGPSNLDVSAGDLTQIEAHGTQFTHLDALNHMGRFGTWYGGYSAEDPNGPSIVDLASHVLFTRAILADIPQVRGTEWVDPSEPVTGNDIDRALALQGGEFQSGDALLLYMGRDRFEDAGNRFDLEALASDRKLPGAGAQVARWIAEHDVSLLAWDFLDAFPRSDTEPSYQVHSLIWAIGLLLLDNCHLAPAADQVRASGRCTGALIVGTPPVPGATGALVQPIFVQ
jgi:kynurenine formamidase